MNGLLVACARLWQFLRDVVTVLRPCRFSALAVVAGAALLLSSQGLELTVRLPSESLGKAAWFDVCVFLWAFQSWYWARLALDLTFGMYRGAAPLDHPRSDRLKRIILQTPRILAAGSYAVAFTTCMFAGLAAWLIGLVLAIEGVLFYVFLVMRKRSTGAAASGGWRRSLLAWHEEGGHSLHSLPLLSKIILWLTLAFAAALTAWVCADAVGFGWYFGAAAVPFLGFSVLVPVGSLFVLLARDGGTQRLAGYSRTPLDTRRAYPVIGIMLLVAAAISFFPALDNHGVRTIQAGESGAVPLDRFLESWHAQAPRLADGRANYIVVSAAGGGLRAAFWTATVLGAIQDQEAPFRRQLVGISGVSGGSLGAAVFVTLAGQPSLADGRRNCGAAPVGPFQCAGETVLSQDFLAPAVAALLLPDFVQRFAPFGFPDRAKALEQSWERAWGEAGFPESLWRDRGFRALWAGCDYLPALLLNGTHVETGKRVITSNIDIAGSPEVFHDAYDFYRLMPAGSEVRPSTAAHNSARFTYVSPAGTLSDGTHLVDGAYFENFGAVAAEELLDAGIRRWGGAIRPLVILISNDPGLGERDLPTARPQALPKARRETWASELLSPLRALLHTRDARGLLAASDLRVLAEESGGAYFQFRLCRQAGHADPALGWVLSDESEELMREQLASDACGNAAELKALLGALRAG